MLGFNICFFIFLFIVTFYFETKGVSTADKAMGTFVSGFNNFLIGNKRLYCLPYFYFITLTTDVEALGNYKASLSSFMVFIVLFFILWALYFFCYKINMAQFLANVVAVWKSLGKSFNKKQNDNSNGQHKIGIQVSKEQFIFFMNDFLFVLIFIITTSFILSKVLIHLLNYYS